MQLSKLNKMYVRCYNHNKPYSSQKQKKPTQGRFRYLLIKDHVYTVDERPYVVFASSHPFLDVFMVLIAMMFLFLVLSYATTIAH